MDDRILEVLAKTTAQDPAFRDELQKRIGATGTQLDDSLERLYAARLINRAKVTRKGATREALWTTGSSLPRAFTLSHKKRPFYPPRPPRPEQATSVGDRPMNKATTTAAANDPVKQPAIGDLILAALAGSTKENPVHPKELSERLGRQQSAWNVPMARLIGAEKVMHTESHQRRGTNAYYLAPVEATSSPSGASSSPADQPQVSETTAAAECVTTPPVAPPAVAPGLPSLQARGDHVSDNPPKIEFGIQDDGSMSIYDGDELMVLPPEATRRLGYFLGCFDRAAWPPRLDAIPAESTPESQAA